ncbi:c-type cytochrome [Pelomicrobium sp.]|jgi:cytochrome c553|uniref:c-type cytochrome n=1 Tax=Pelomicrobium sp. TaxID=2815319 RepID=UPI002FDE3358
MTDRGMGRGAWKVLALAVLMAAIPAHAGDAAAGRQKAIQCQACHGLDGLARIPQAPQLAGQNAVYLEKALKEYRSGARKDEMMSVVAKGLSDQDIRDLAAYYQSIEIVVKPPR